MDPGIEIMVDYAKMKRLRARLPPPEDVASALNRFFAFKNKRKQAIEDIQAQLALQAVRYCLDSQTVDANATDAQKKLVSRNTWEAILNTLHRSARTSTAAHVDLAKFMYENKSGRSLYEDRLAARAYTNVLGAGGHSDEALKVAFEFEKLWSAAADPAEEPVSGHRHEDDMDTAATWTSRKHYSMSVVWNSALWAFTRQPDESKLLEVLDMLHTRNIILSTGTKRAILEFFLGRTDTKAVQKWFSDLWAERNQGPVTNELQTGKDLRAVLSWCLQHDQIDVGHQLVRQAMSENAVKPVWDAIFVWAAGTGKGPDEINRMMDVMEDANASIANQDQWRIPDIDTINILVEFATSKNDPYMAERFIALGKERGISPNAKTYVLQMDYRLKVKDVDGALVAYTNLQSMDLSSNDDVPSINKLIVALCDGKRHDFETVMNVAADLSDRRARFEALTVSKLALLHLSRDEVADVVDLLNTHALNYSSLERGIVRDALFTFCVDPNTQLPRSWDAYTVLRNSFDEIARPQREKIMTNYFKRERPDLAVHVFNGMRSHSRSDTIPTINTYVSAFLCSARLRDLESLELIHNQLKLDYNINVNTYLYNALIISYTACGKPRRAIDFWNDIVASKEGPSYRSIHVAMRACEQAPFGDLKAQKIWAKLRKQNVELDQSMWASYAAALAGNGDNELAISTLEQAESNSEVELDAHVIGSLLTGAAGQSKQSEIEAWAKEKYPHVWEELERVGFELEEDGMKTAKIDRTVAP